MSVLSGMVRPIPRSRSRFSTIPGVLQDGGRPKLKSGTEQRPGTGPRIILPNESAQPTAMVRMVDGHDVHPAHVRDFTRGSPEANSSESPALSIPRRTSSRDSTRASAQRVDGFQPRKVLLL